MVYDLLSLLLWGKRQKTGQWHDKAFSKNMTVLHPLMCACPLTNRRKTGVQAELFLKKSASGLKIFLAAQAVIAGFGEGTPQQDSMWGRLSRMRNLAPW